MTGTAGPRLRAIILGLALALPGLALPGPAFAENAPSASTPSSTPAPAPAPSQSQGATATPAAPPAPALPGENEAAAQTIELPARPAVVVAGAAKWDVGFKAITDAIGKARAAALNAHLKEGGRPLTAFVDTDDDGFKFEAMLPLETAPTGAVDLGADARIGATPAGKAIKFQHRGAYDDVDATYEAITAYLDEKGYDAQNVFLEEYLNDPKGSDDSALELDIYVLIK